MCENNKTEIIFKKRSKKFKKKQLQFKKNMIKLDKKKAKRNQIRLLK